MSIANGEGAPRLKIKKRFGGLVTVDLPMPESNIETPNPVDDVDEDFERNTLIDRRGFKPRWTISYETHYDGLDLLLLHHLFDRELLGISLVPHVDLPTREFAVRLVNPGEIRRFGVTQAHAGIKLVFESTQILSGIPFPQAGLSGRTWADMGNETWASTGPSYYWHFFL